jgi:hypothetical protein
MRSTRPQPVRSLPLFAVTILVALSTAGAGCRASEPGTAAAAAPAAPAASVPIAAVDATPHGGASPISDHTGATISTPSVVFELPSRWRRETPSSPARLAQAVIPGDSGPGELAIFHFGADRGGSVESNFARWQGQMRRPTGAAEPSTGQLAANAAGFSASWIDIAGTLMPTGMGGPTEEQPDFRLLGAVVEGPGGPWFFKATGPDATLAAARAEFLELLKSARLP